MKVKFNKRKAKVLAFSLIIVSLFVLINHNYIKEEFYAIPDPTIGPGVKIQLTDYTTNMTFAKNFSFDWMYVYTSNVTFQNTTSPIIFNATFEYNNVSIELLEFDLDNNNVTINCTSVLNESNYVKFTFESNKTGYENYMKEVDNCEEGQIVNLLGPLITTPSVTFISQIPQDINSINIYNNGLNITYEIEDESEITNITLFYKTNSTESNIMQYVNGTAIEGWFSKNDYYVNGSNYTFILNPDDVYSGVFNIKPKEMEGLSKNAYSLTKQSNLIKIMFLNLSDDDDYNDLLINVENISTNPGLLQFFYCNSSYTSGRPENSIYCYNVYNLPNEDSMRVNYPNSSTKYYVIPLGLNSTTHEIGDVKVTPISYIVLKGPFSGDGWNVYYVSNITRHDTVQVSNNNGNTWQDFSGTIDAHIHQFSGSDKFYYYVNVTNEWNNTNISSVRSDLLDLYGLPPSAPMVYRPIEGVYYGLISINYTKAISPNGYDIVKYNISLVNLDLTYNQTITENNYQNLSYVWDSGYTLPGEYLIKVTACDSQNQCSYGVSDNITIDNWLTFLSLTENHDYNWIKWSWTAKGVEPIDYYVYVRDSEGDIIENWTNIGGNTSYFLFPAQSNTKYIITIKAQDYLNQTEEITGVATTKLLSDVVSTYTFINIFVMIVSIIIYYIGKRRSGVGYYFIALILLLVNMYYSFSIPFEVENGYIKPTSGNVVLFGFNLILFIAFLTQTVIDVYRMLTW